MTSPSTPASNPRSFETQVDLGSWARFTPSLGTFLQEVCRPGSPASPGAPMQWAGATLLLTAPKAVVSPTDLPRRRGGWLGILGPKALLQPSPDLPGLVLIGRGDGVEVVVPARDAQDRALLGTTELQALEALDWQGHEALSKVMPDGPSAAQYATRILIEVLRVPHPADLDHLLHAH